MRVHICRRAQIGVSEQLLNEFQISSFLVDDGRRRVAECVEASRPALASDAEAIQRWIEHVTSEHIGIEGRTVFLAEDEIFRAIVIRVLFLRRQRGQQRRAEVDQPYASLRLRCD